MKVYCAKTSKLEARELYEKFSVKKACKKLSVKGRIFVNGLSSVLLKLYLSSRCVNMMIGNIYDGVHLSTICCGPGYTSIQVLGLQYNLLWIT